VVVRGRAEEDVSTKMSGALVRGDVECFGIRLQGEFTEKKETKNPPNEVKS
jgi:hypothetical protein